MHIQNSHKIVNQAIQSIITKGGQKLYESYLKTKIPNHATIQIADVISQTFHTPYSHVNPAKPINKQTTPQGILQQTLLPNRINKYKIDEEIPSNILSTLSFRKQLLTKNKIRMKNKLKNTNGSMTERPFSNKSSLCQSLLNCQEKQADDIKHVRKQKQKSIIQEEKFKKHQQQIQKQKSFRRRSLQHRIQQLEVHGIPYAYDQQGNIIAPSIKEHKDNQSFNAGKEKRGNKMLNIKFQTLQLTSNQRYSIQQMKHIIGRKRGFVSSKFYKKLKMTNEEFNNQNSRQCSNIPYLNLTEGIKVIERQRNIIAQKRRRNNLSKDQFQQKTQSNFFKSFMPDFDLTSMQTMSVDRPYTTAQMNRTKRTSETINTQKLQSSILWRPRTTSKNCRVNINDQQLVKRVIQID